MYDGGFLINPGELEDTDWCYAFELDVNSPMGLALSLAISNLKEKLGNSYLIRHIINEIYISPKYLDNFSKIFTSSGSFLR